MKDKIQQNSIKDFSFLLFGQNDFSSAKTEKILYVKLLCKRTTSGNFVWAKQMGVALGDDYGADIAVDGVGNVYTTGRFEFTVDFNPGAGTFELTSVDETDIFVSKLNTSGNFVWAKQLGGGGTQSARDITVDGNSNVYTTGYFVSTADFDPGAGIFELTSAGATDVFVSNLDTSGNFLWAKAMGGTGSDYGEGIAVDGSGNVYTTGSFQGTADFDPGPGIANLTSAGGDDIFVSKLQSGYSVTFNANGGSDTMAPQVSRVAANLTSNTFTRIGYTFAGWDTNSAGTTVVYTNGASYPFTADASLYAVWTALSNPALIWNTFLGGNAYDQGFDTVVDASGNTYVTGNTNSTWGTPIRAYSGDADAFVAKLDASGNLLWNTFLGGVSNDGGSSIAMDASGNIYVTGFSTSSWGSPLNAFGGTIAPFVAKLNSSGVLQWNTFLGGNSDVRGNSIILDGSGNIYVAGFSYATWGTPVRAYTNGVDAYVAKLNSSGALQWNTFLGGTGTDQNVGGVAVDGSGNVYVTGFSNATWQGASAPVRTFAGDTYSDAFAAKLNSSGALQWNTFLGALYQDQAYDLILDGSNNIYVAGTSTVEWGSPLRTNYGGGDAFVGKLNSSGNLLWNTFLGGSSYEYAQHITMDGTGNIYVAGIAYSGGWQGTSAPVRAYTNGKDAFAAELNPTGALLLHTFMGGTSDDYAYSIAVSGSDVIMSGESSATWGLPVRAYTGNTDAFVVKFPVPTVYTVTFDTNGGSAGTYISQTAGTPVSAPTAPTKDGYTFDGWYTDNGAFLNVYTFSTMPAANLILYAKWTANQYTITFNSNVGSAVNPITQDFGSVVTAPADPTKTGNTFAGWYSDAGLTTPYTFNRMPAQNITLYARWNATGCVVTTNANNGAGSLRQAVIDCPANGTITFDSSLSGATITIAPPTIRLSKNVTIDGSSLAVPVRIKAVEQHFVVNAGITVRFIALRISDATRQAVINWGNLSIADSIFDNNFSGGTLGGSYGNAQQAGAIAHYGGTLSVTNSTFSGNSASLTGGAIFAGKPATITNSTFYGNKAQDGGAISVYNPSGVVIRNSTFMNNSATRGGKDFYDGGGKPTLYNTIANCGGVVTDGGNNIDLGASCGYTAAKGSLSMTNPLLGALSYNGGRTQTMALLAGSPAINA